MDDESPTFDKATEISRATRIYKETESLRNLLSGWITSDNPDDLITYRTLWKSSDCVVQESYHYMYQDHSLKTGQCTPVIPAKKPGLVKYNLKCGVWCELYNYEDDKKFGLDLWNSQGMLRRFDLSGLELHGRVYMESEFASLGFSENGNKVVYLAEKKVNKPVSFFKESPSESSDVGEVYKSVDYWGEQLEKCSDSVICVLDLGTGDVQIITPPSGVFSSKPVWCGNDVLYFLGLNITSFRHGAIYCWNRPGVLMSYNLGQNTFTSCSPRSGKSVYMPSPNHSTGDVAFLMCEANGPHRKYMEVVVFSSRTGQLKVIPDSLFFGVLSPNPWIDDENLLIEPCEETQSLVAKLSVKTAELEYVLDSSKETCSLSVLDQYKDKVLLSISDLRTYPHQKQSVYYCDLGKNFTIDHHISLLKPSNKCDYQIQHFTREGRDYNGILTMPGEGVKNNNILVIFPHGGPHSLYTTSFKSDPYVLSQLGYSTLMVNYTGSLGLGEASVKALPGHVGDMDVKDVHHAATQCAPGFRKVVVMGGSHGGFLTAHLIGQYPEFYSAASMRNPVTDLTSMVGVTDIPDWCYCEAGLSYDALSPPAPTSDILVGMFDKSPIRYIGNVKCPVLMLIGAQDLRVPPSQGVRYAKLLESRGVKCDLRVYSKDCHPLNSVPVAADTLVQTHLWFTEHTS